MRTTSKTPSRYLPAYVSEPVSLRAKAFLVAFLVGLVYAIWNEPDLLSVLGGLVLLGVILQWKGNRVLKRLAAERKDESICTFARSFDRKVVDTWIIRAVHQELQVYVKYPDGVCPIRSTDRLDQDLHIDLEDIDDLFPVIAQRTGRSTKNTESNPYYGKVSTAGDLVLFVNSQPRATT